MTHGLQSVTSNEYKVREDQNLLSRTDKDGRITYATDTFVEVSGYRREELIGAPHSIVRHPDMPAEAFANLWQTISRGEVWVGLVKNRRKNGDYYWVRAHVTPIVENGEVQGYTSVRIKPTDEEVLLAEQTYARLRAGNGRGISLERGRIVKTGLAARLTQLNLRSIRARACAALGINLLLLFLALAMVFWREVSLTAKLDALPVDQPLDRQGLDSILQAQMSYDYLQLGLLGVVALLSAGAFALILRTVREEIRTATQFTMQIAAGNLAAPRPARSNNEFDTLTGMLAVMQRSLGNIANGVHSNLKLVRPATGKMVNGSTDLAARTEQQAAALQQTASSLEEITSTVQQNAAHAREASQLANASAAQVRDGGTAMHEVVERMGRITHSSRQIGEIIGVIDAIAFQTNILALNASVEAARAGEHGRGFAVVASEVRNLATRSANAAEEVRQLIAASHREIAEGEVQVQRAEQAIVGITAAVLKVNEIMGEITIASDEQNRAIEQVNVAVAQMDSVTQRNAELVVDSARAAQTIEQQVGELASNVDVLRLAGRGPERVEQAPPRPASVASSKRPEREPVWQSEAAWSSF